MTRTCHNCANHDDCEAHQNNTAPDAGECETHDAIADLDPELLGEQMQDFMVVGIALDGGGRYADTYGGATPEEAEDAAKAWYRAEYDEELTVAAVINAAGVIVR